MRTIRHTAALILLIAMSALTLASCTADADEAFNLSGYWEGTIYGNYYYNRYNYNSTWDTEIRFDQEDIYSNGGTGREIDYDRNGRSYQSDFTWRVKNSKIYIQFNDGYRIVIRQYDLYSVGSRMKFKGVFESWDTGEEIATFDLIKTSGWSNMAKQHTMQPLDNDSLTTTTTQQEQ